VFKNVLKARQFLSSQAVHDAEPRMVVRAKPRRHRPDRQVPPA